MQPFKVKLEVEVEVDAFTQEDANQLASETIYEMEGLGVTVIDVSLKE
jgi:hypothetical protein